MDEEPDSFCDFVFFDSDEFLGFYVSNYDKHLFFCIFFLLFVDLILL